MRLRDRQRKQRERTLARQSARRAKPGAQLVLPIRRRKKMGRPRKHDAGVAHVRRPAHLARLPLHVTLRVEPRVWNLRSQRSFKVIQKAFWGAMNRSSAKICHFSVLGNHIHMIIEATDREVLSSAMRSLGVRLGKGMNSVMHSRGRVVAGRYLARELRTPSQVARARRYVLDNFAQHAREWGERLPARFVDPYSSAATRGFPPPETWLLDVGWRRAAG